MAAISAPKSTKKERWAWYMYDFGNSAYAAVVLLAIYSAYFKGTVVGGSEGSRIWGLAIAAAMITVAVTAPVLGAIADFSGSKKRFLFGYTVMACFFTGMLYFVQKGDVVLGVGLFIFAEIGYRSAQVFYNSLLPEIAEPEDIGRVSGAGWAIGSLGGIICLVIVLVAVQTIESIPTGMVVRFAMIFTALFYLIATIPTFVWLKERTQPQTLPDGENYFSLAFKKLAQTFKTVRNFREFIKFIVAFLVYNDGIMMALNFAAILGGTLYGMNQEELIIFMIIVQVASVVSAFGFGWMADKMSGKITVIISLLLMIVAAIWMYFNTSAEGFYYIGILAGFALTGVQSVSRTMVGMFAPAGQSAEFYGFFAVSGRTSSFIGPAVFGLVAAGAADFYERQGEIAEIADQLGHRFAVLTIVIFLLVGLILLLFVDEDKGREAAMSIESIEPAAMT